MANEVQVSEVVSEGVRRPRTVDMDDLLEQHRPGLVDEPFDSVATGVAAAGTVQGDATEVGLGVTVVGTVGVNAGVILPVPLAAGRRAYVFNRGANALDVYPASGGTIDGGAANAPLILAAGEGAVLVAVTAADWHAIVGA